MITDEKYYILPEVVRDLYQNYHDSNMYANFVRLNNGLYAISERVKNDFPSEFSSVETYIRENDIIFEFRELA